MTTTRLITLNTTSARRTTVLHSGTHGTIYAIDGLAARPMNYCTTCGVNGGTLCTGKRGGHLAHPHPVRVLEVLGEAHPAQPAAAHPLTLDPSTITRRVRDAGIALIATRPFTSAGTVVAALVETPSSLVAFAVHGWATGQGYEARFRGEGDVLLTLPEPYALDDEVRRLGYRDREHLLGARTAEAIEGVVEASDLEPAEVERCSIALAGTGGEPCSAPAGHAGRGRDASGQPWAHAFLAERVEPAAVPVVLAAGDLVRGAVVLTEAGSRWFGVFDLEPITLDSGRLGVRVWPAQSDLERGWGAGEGADHVDLDAALLVSVDAASVD